MDVLVAGPPGPMLRWTSALVAAAVATVHPAVEHACAGDSWTPRDPPEQKAAARVMTAHQVSETHAAAIRAGAVRAVLVLDRPGCCYGEPRAAGHAPVPALRHLVACATPLGDLATCPGALILARDGERNAGQILPALADHVGLALEGSALAGLSARFGIAGPRTALDEALLRCEPPEAVPPVLSPEDEAMARAVLAPAFGYGATGTRLEVVWPRDCLFWGDRPNDGPPPRIIDITGRARNLVYGPYFPLAPGRWRMGATLAFSASARGARLALSLFGPDNFGGCRFTVERAGVFAAAAMVTVPSSRAPAEIRLALEQGAIEGKLGLDGITFTPEPG
jgi:hypothetical protein